MDNLADLLANRKRDEPPEIRLIKDYVLQQFKETVGVLVRERDIVITVRSSALAGALRMHSYKLSLLLQELQPEADISLQRRLVFRIGS